MQLELGVERAEALADGEPLIEHLRDDEDRQRHAAVLERLREAREAALVQQHLVAVFREVVRLEVDRHARQALGAHPKNRLPLRRNSRTASAASTMPVPAMTAICPSPGSPALSGPTSVNEYRMSSTVSSREIP